MAEALPKPAFDYSPDVRHFSVGSHWLYEEDSRFDATTYSSGAFAALDAIEACPHPKESIGYLCGTIWHPVQNQARSNFKRIYTKEDYGVPFAGSREMFFLPLRPKRFLAKRMPKLGELMVPEGWLLLSRSGTVGNVLFVNRSLGRCAITDHAIRIEPTKVPAGYLYAFLSSSYGQPLIAKGAYGATVDEIEPKHIATIPLPLPPESVQRSIHSKIIRAYELRDEANEVLDEAEGRLYKLLGISPFSEDDIEYLGKPEEPRAFSVSSTELCDRFDATHHIPLVRSVIHKLEKGKYPLIALGKTDTTIKRPPRFKRIYVKAEAGVPFFQPSYVPLFRPHQVTYLSKTANASVMSDCMLKADSVIITRSGTAARSCLVTEQLTKWAGSDDLIRVLPGNDFDGGFLNAFLSTPFGRHQILAQLYGGVVDHVDESHVAAVLCPHVPATRQKEIGNLVRRAFNNRDEANELEDQAIAEVEAVIQ